MEANEDKELKKIVEAFTKAIQLFHKRDYKIAGDAFDKIVETYKDSENHHVLEIQNRAKAIKTMCEGQLNPVKMEFTDDEDYLMGGIYYLNAGNLDRSLEFLTRLEKSGYKETYVNYLLSIVHFKNENVESSLEYLKKTIEKDPFYKVIAHNEPAFDQMFENEEFVALMDS